MWAVAAYLWPTTLVHFETLVMKMLGEMIEYGCKIKEEVKAIQIEITQNIKEPMVKGRKPGLKSTIWNKRKK